VKTDEQIKKVVTASIRRHSRNLETWENTKLWDEGKIEINSHLYKVCKFQQLELPIIYSFINLSNWTLFTTKSVHCCFENDYFKVNILEINHYKLGNFKGHGSQNTEELILETKDGKTYKCLYETSYESMGTVYAIKTLIQIS
jgi:hypothetical protein